MAKLRTHVHVTDDAGQTHVFGPHSVVPDWARAAITNPKVWVPEESTSDDEPEADDAEGTGPDDAGDIGDPAADAEVPVVSEPARSGPGSSRDRWAAYAEQLGITVDDQMSRDDIMAAVDEQAS